VDFIFADYSWDIRNLVGCDVCSESRIYWSLAAAYSGGSNSGFNQFFYQANFKNNHSTFKNPHFWSFWLGNQYVNGLAG